MITKILSIAIWCGIGALVMFFLCCLAAVAGSGLCPLTDALCFGAICGGLLRLAYFMGWLDC